MNIPNLIGFLGVGLILLWYFLLQIGKCKSNDLSFSTANAIGAACILYSLMYEWNTPTVVIEIAWLLISVYGIGKYFCEKKCTDLKSDRNKA
jgi:hypothetical protein